MKILSRKAILQRARYIVWLGIAYAIAMVFAEKWWLLETLSNGRLLVFGVVLLAAALSLLALAPLRMLTGLLASAWLAWPALPYFGIGKLAIFGDTGNSPTVNSATTGKLRVVSFNIGSKNTPMDALVRQLESTPSSHRPDCILLMEVRTPTYRAHFETLRRIYPHHVAEARDDNFGIWLMSKHPLKSHGLTKSDRAAIGDIPLIDVDLKTNGQTVRLLGGHPFPPIDKASAAARNEYFRVLEQRAIDAGKTPLIVMGDLNCAKWSPVFTSLAHAANIRSAAYGYGMQTTWTPFPKLPLLGLPIDHILISPEIIVEEFAVGATAGSDHRPVSATLSLPTPD